MLFFSRLKSLLRNLFRKQRADQDLDEELRTFVEMLAEEKIKVGATPEEARRAARIELGGVEQVKEHVREARVGAWLDTLLQDIRFGLRMLRKNPGFTIVAILTLALGIGANTAIFSVVNAVLLQPLPYRDPARLVYISEIWPRATPVKTVPSPDFTNWIEHDRLLEGLAAYGGGAEVSLASDMGPERVRGAAVTADLFALLGIPPFRGRGFLREDELPGAPNVVLLSQELWNERFASQMRIIGKPVNLDGVPYTVVGIMPAGFRFPDDQFKPQFFLPMVAARAAYWGSPENFRLLRPLARLKPEVTPEQAQNELTALARSTAAEEPPRFVLMRAGMEVHVTPLKERLAAPVRPILLMLLASVVLLLAVSCVNVTCLQLARSAARQKELAVRVALGASRIRLISQTLAESFVLAMIAVPLSLLVGFAGLRALRALGATRIPHLESVHLDPFMLHFTLIVAMATSVFFGLWPAIFASRTEPAETLKQGGQSGRGFEYGRARNVLVTAEIAMAAVLLTGSGLLARSFLHLTLVDSGFDSRRLLIFQISLSGTEYSKPEQQANFFSQLVSRLRALPGVQSADAGSGLPIVGWGSLRGTNVEGQPQLPAGLRTDVACDAVTSQYFSTLHIPLVAGREFDNRDRRDSPLVAVVNRAFVSQFLPNEDPLGKHIGAGAQIGPWREIIGVVGNVKQQGPSHAESPEIYIPYVQEPAPDMYLVLRTAADPRSSVGAVKAAVHDVDASQPVYNVATMEERVRESIASQRFDAQLVSAFAALALGLGAIGVYGVLAYSVTQRTHEIGVRMALGAGAHDVLAMVIRQALLLVIFGVAIGLTGASVLTRTITAMLYGVTPTDPLTFIGVAGLLSLVALAATYIPARRAMRVDPMVALRHE